VAALAGLYATRTGAADTTHLRSAFRRAARGLASAGVIEAGYTLLATRREGLWRSTAAREALCVWLPGNELTGRDLEDAALLFHAHAYQEPASPFTALTESGL